MMNIAFILFSLVLSGCIGFQKQPEVGEFPIAGHRGNLACGIGKAALTPYKKTAMAGYGPGERIAEKTFVDSHRGETHHGFARAVVLTNGGDVSYGKRYLAYVSVDLLIITDALREAVFEQLPDDTIAVLCATHPHSCIGGYWQGFLPELAVMGSYNPENLHYLAKKIATAVEAARSSVEPAKIGFVHSQLSGLTKNRRRDSDAVDTNIQIIHIETTAGKPRADLIWFAAHATMMPSDIHEFSSDFPGVLTRKLEKDRTDYVAMFFQGGLGDIRPSPAKELWKRSEDRTVTRINKMVAVGQALAEKVVAISKDAKTSREVYISHATPRFYLGRVNVNAVPDLLIPIEIIARCWVAFSYMPNTSKLALTKIDNGNDDVLIANFPFEISSQLTIDLRHQLQEKYDIGIVTSLANGWYSYLMHWPSAMWPPWGPEYIESFVDPGYAESLFEYVRKAAYRMYEREQ